MANRKKTPPRKWYLFLFILLVLVGLLGNQLLFGRITRFKSSYYSPHYTTKIYPLMGNAQIAQDFTSKYPGLYRIDLFFNNQGNIEGDVIFYLKRNSCETVENIEVISAKISNIIEKEPYPFIFSPIDDSMGQKFCVVVETRSSSQEHLGVYVSPVDVYTEGEGLYRQNGLELQKQEPNPIHQANYHIWLPIVQKSPSLGALDVGFRAHYNPPIRTMIIPLLMQLSANKPNLLGSPVFYLFLLVVYVIVVAIFLGFVVKIKVDPKL